jgi:hypothetical protein
MGSGCGVICLLIKSHKNIGFFKMTQTNVQYVTDAKGKTTAVLVPISLWREIESEKETAYLLKNIKMKTRLLEAKKHKEGIPFEEACEKLGI